MANIYLKNDPSRIAFVSDLTAFFFAPGRSVFRVRGNSLIVLCDNRNGTFRTARVVTCDVKGADNDELLVSFMLVMKDTTSDSIDLSHEAIMQPYAESFEFWDNVASIKICHGYHMQWLPLNGVINVSDWGSCAFTHRSEVTCALDLIFTLFLERQMMDGHPYTFQLPFRFPHVWIAHAFKSLNRPLKVVWNDQDEGFFTVLKQMREDLDLKTSSLHYVQLCSDSARSYKTADFEGLLASVVTVDVRAEDLPIEAFANFPNLQHLLDEGIRLRRNDNALMSFLIQHPNEIMVTQSITIFGLNDNDDDLMQNREIDRVFIKYHRNRRALQAFIQADRPQAAQLNPKRRALQAAAESDRPLAALQSLPAVAHSFFHRRDFEPCVLGIIDAMVHGPGFASDVLGIPSTASSRFRTLAF